MGSIALDDEAERELVTGFMPPIATTLEQVRHG
jgi:hypothetical protein